MPTVRTIFVSDVHLGTRASRADLLLEFLATYRAEAIYLVGDIVDVWALRTRWHWSAEHLLVVCHLVGLSRQGVRIVYVPGNHDDVVHAYSSLTLEIMEVESDTIHVAADGRRYLVVHGDRFDRIGWLLAWNERVGAWFYRHLPQRFRHARGKNTKSRIPSPGPFALLHNHGRHAVAYLVGFKRSVVKEAQRRGAAGVICGHIHQPMCREILGTSYCNDGDWVENCTALVEHHDGRMEIVHWHTERARHVSRL